MHMKKASFRSFLSFLFIAALVFGAPHLAISAQPGLQLHKDVSGVKTWTTNADTPFTGLSHDVKVVDYDGIADDGSSHTVTVTYPDRSTVKTLEFNYKKDANSAIYELWDGDIPQPIDAGTYTGNYVYRVTEVPGGDWTEATDYLDVDTVNLPDETTFSPRFDTPQAITAYFDDVYVNGSLYDDFESGFGSNNWNWQPSEVTYESGEVRFEQTYNPGRGSRWMNFKNPEGINEIKATVRVDSVTSNRPRARIRGTFCRDSEGDVSAQVGVRENDAVYGVSADREEGYHAISEDLVPLTSLGSVTQGNNYELSIEWDGNTFTFGVKGLDDAVDYTATYTPSGPISSPDDPWKGIGLTCWIVLDSTTPTFDWDEVPGGTNHYRVRIYSMNNNTIYRSYVKSPPYTLPPGILKPNSLYKYRIEALKDHQWFEWDNVARSDRDKTRFITGPDEAQNPYVDLWSTGVQTWTDAAPFGANTFFYLRIHDAQGVPGNIDSVKALLPDGVTEVSLYLDYNESDTCGAYRGVYFGDIQEGTYTFTVVDKDANSDTNTEVLTSNPIGSPSEGSLQPANNTVVGGTGVSFDWDDVTGAAFYQLRLYDKDLNNLFNISTTESQYTLPAGILKEGSLYRYRVQTRREFFEDNEDNGSSVPSGGVWNANTFFTTETNGTADPSLNLDSYGVAVRHAPHPVTGDSVYWLDFMAMVTDSDGVPENIERVEVTYPDGTTTHLLRFDDSPDWGINYSGSEVYTDPSLIPSGTYTFKVVDFDGNEVTLQDELPDVASNILDWATNVTPVDGTILDTTTPTITWDSVDDASYYKVRIMSSWIRPTIHWSDELTQTQYRVPTGILEPSTTYGYRVYAFLEPTDSEVDFYSCNRSWHSSNYRFTTPPTLNQSPTASFTATPTSGEAPLSVTFDASASSDQDGTIDSYSWDFGDGSSGSGETTSHEYTSADNYTVTLTVTDDDGATDTATGTITVTEPAPTSNGEGEEGGNGEEGGEGEEDGGGPCFIGITNGD